MHGFRGAFDVVKVANEMPHRYGKRGELLIAYDETEEAREMEGRRRSSIARQGGMGDAEKDAGGDVEKNEIS